MHLTYYHSLAQVTLTTLVRVARAPMTITGLCQPENASQIKFPSGKSNALSGQSIKAQVTQRPAIL